MVLNWWLFHKVEINFRPSVGKTCIEKDRWDKRALSSTVVHLRPVRMFPTSWDLMGFYTIWENLLMNCSAAQYFRRPFYCCRGIFSLKSVPIPTTWVANETLESTIFSAESSYSRSFSEIRRVNKIKINEKQTIMLKTNFTSTRLNWCGILDLLITFDFTRFDPLGHTSYRKLNPGKYRLFTLPIFIIFKKYAWKII
jgi:hypothetical protein